MPKKKILLVLGAAVMLLAAYRLGILETFASPVIVRQRLLGLGPLGYLAFLAAFALLQPFGVPGVMFIAAASLVWSPLVASVLSVTGSALASVFGFSFARYLGRDWVEKKLPPRLRKYDERLAERGFMTVFVLRAIFWTQPALHLLFGISRVRFSTHLVASVLAYIPPILLISYYGDRAFEMVKAQPPERLAAALAGIVIAIGLGWALRRPIASRSRGPGPPPL